jgi:hypothetical protein
LIQNLRGKDNVLEQLSSTISDDCRVLKQVIFNRKNDADKLYSLIVEDLNSKGDLSAAKVSLNNFKVLLKNILYIGQTITHEKEFHEIFINLMEKIVETCVSLGMTCEDLDGLLDEMILKMESFDLTSVNESHQVRFRRSFCKMVLAVKLSSVRLFQSCSGPSVFGF